MSQKRELSPGCMGVPLEFASPPCLAGIDTRPLHWTVSLADSVPGEFAPRVIRPLFLGDLRDENEVLFVLRQYQVRLAVVDCRPEATLATRLQKDAERFGIDVWRAEYNTAPTSIRIIRNEKERLLKLDRTGTLDQVHNAFQTGLGAALPQNFRDVGQFVTEMTSSTKVFVRSQRREYYTWENSGDDHAFHAFNLLMVAFEMTGLLRWNSGTVGAERGIVESSAGDTGVVLPGREEFRRHGEGVFMEV